MTVRMLSGCFSGSRQEEHDERFDRENKKGVIFAGEEEKDPFALRKTQCLGIKKELIKEVSVVSRERNPYVIDRYCNAISAELSLRTQSKSKGSASDMDYSRLDYDSSSVDGLTTGQASPVDCLYGLKHLDSICENEAYCADQRICLVFSENNSKDTAGSLHPGVPSDVIPSKTSQSETSTERGCSETERGGSSSSEIGHGFSSGSENGHRYSSGSENDRQKSSIASSNTIRNFFRRERVDKELEKKILANFLFSVKKGEGDEEKDDTNFNRDYAKEEKNCLRGIGSKDIELPEYLTLASDIVMDGLVETWFQTNRPEVRPPPVDDVTAAAVTYSRKPKLSLRRICGCFKQ